MIKLTREKILIMVLRVKVQFLKNKLTNAPNKGNKKLCHHEVSKVVKLFKIKHNFLLKMPFSIPLICKIQSEKWDIYTVLCIHNGN